ncbi:hypothetical protein [Dyella sp.]|uniref:hypothetical protein n=1 Tax=Dyella sp. TaxID=1869338 RepID=UPI002ED14462
MNYLQQLPPIDLRILHAAAALGFEVRHGLPDIGAILRDAVRIASRLDARRALAERYRRGQMGNQSKCGVLHAKHIYRTPEAYCFHAVERVIAAIPVNSGEIGRGLLFIIMIASLDKSPGDRDDLFYTLRV